MVDHHRHILGEEAEAPILEHDNGSDDVLTTCCFSAFRRWPSRPKKSSPASLGKPESSDQANFGDFSQCRKEIGCGIEEETKIHKLRSFRYGPDATTPRNDQYSSPKGLYKHKNVEGLLPQLSSPLSRTASKGTPSSLTSSSVGRSKSRKSTETCSGIHSSLSTSSSRMGSNLIMFSNSTGRKVKPPTILKDLNCTLEELCYGCVKKVKVTRDVLTETGQIIQEEEIFRIKVKPGWKTGTKITFEGMGNERPGTSPADVTFIIAEKQHPLFQREGDHDLEIVIEIPLVRALTGCEISIPLLGGEQMSLATDDIIYPGYERIIRGQGMPILKEQDKRGDLKVVFLVEFPSELTDEQRSDIVNILDDSVLS